MCGTGLVLQDLVSSRLRNKSGRPIAGGPHAALPALAWSETPGEVTGPGYCAFSLALVISAFTTLSMLSGVTGPTSL
jgi:hypothetical protein